MSGVDSMDRSAGQAIDSSNNVHESSGTIHHQGNGMQAAIDHHPHGESFMFTMTSLLQCP